MIKRGLSVCSASWLMKTSLALEFSPKSPWSFLRIILLIVLESFSDDWRYVFRISCSVLSIFVCL